MTNFTLPTHSGLQKGQQERSLGRHWSYWEPEGSYPKMNCRTGSVLLPKLARNVLIEKCNHSVNHIFFFLSLLSEFLGMVRGSSQSTDKAISDSDRVDDVDWRLWRKFIDLMNFMLLQHWYRRINFSCKLGSQSWRKVKCCLSRSEQDWTPRINIPNKWMTRADSLLSSKSMKRARNLLEDWENIISVFLFIVKFRDCG